MPSISIKTRLMLMLILVSVAACSVLIYIGYQSGKEAITETIFNQLTGIRSAKQNQIESYFDQLNRVVEILGENENTTLALLDFKKGYNKLGRKKVNNSCSEQLSDFYTGFVDKLSRNMRIEQSIDLYYPSSSEACYLQYEYIIDNPNPTGKKHLMNSAGDGTYYSKVHQQYHEYFTKVVDKFGFYDLFLIDIETGDLLYSVNKESDFATNLYSGPYRKSNLARLVKKLDRNSDFNASQIVDFDIYRPSYGAPAAFIGIPLRRNSLPVGALVLQLPVDQINQIMTDGGAWEEDGLGKTGESFLVGEDEYMRSVSRMFIQDTAAFKKHQLDIGESEESINRMYTLGSTILKQKVKGEAIDAAFQGDHATKTTENYLGEQVLASYSKLRIKDLDWAIISEIDLSEAFLPVENFTRKVFTSLCIIILVLTFLSILLAGNFLRPIRNLSLGVKKLREKDFNFQIKGHSSGEFGELTNSFNQMMSTLRDQQTKIEMQRVQSDALIHNFLPASIAKRIKKGERDIASKIPNVSLIVIDVIGFSALTEHTDPQRSARLINELVEAFDDSAKVHQIEKIRTAGDIYFAACGLHNPMLDNAKRLLDFALDARKIIHGFNLNHNLDLRIGCSIHAGEVYAGIIGGEKFSYSLWGSTVSNTFNISSAKTDDSILVSDTIYDKLREYFDFSEISPEHLKYELPIKVRALITDEKPTPPQQADASYLNPIN